MHSPLAAPEIQATMLFALLVSIFAAYRQHRRGGASHDELSRLFLWHVAIWTLILTGAAIVEGATTNPILALFGSLIFVILTSLPIALTTYFLVRYALRKLSPRKDNA
jgi:hypothetical protein